LDDLAAKLALRGCDSETLRIGISTKDKFLMPSFETIVLPLKCLLPPLTFFRTVIFLAESGLMEGTWLGPGLWTVSGSNSRDSLLSIWSKSLSKMFTGDDDGELKGVGPPSLFFPLWIRWSTCSGVEEEMDMGIEPTEKFAPFDGPGRESGMKSSFCMGGEGGIGLSSFGSVKGDLWIPDFIPVIGLSAKHGRPEADFKR